MLIKLEELMREYVEFKQLDQLKKKTQRKNNIFKNIVLLQLALSLFCYFYLEIGEDVYYMAVPLVMTLFCWIISYFEIKREILDIKDYGRIIKDKFNR